MTLEGLFLQILNMSITGGICIVGVLLIRRIFRKMPRVYLYALWLIVAFRLICPVSMGGAFSVFNLLPNAQSAGERVYTMDYIQAVWEQVNVMPETEQTVPDQDMDEEKARISQTDLLASGQAGSLSEKAKTRDWLTALVFYGKFVWIAGMAGFLGYFLVSLKRLRHHTKRAVLAREKIKTPWGERCVYECDHMASPFVMGVAHPVIYIPCGLKNPERKLILWHESYHVYRKDYLIKLFSFCLLAVYWFHPLVWLAWKGMCKDMEMSCDEAVLQRLQEPERQDYGRTLLAFASMHSVGRQMPPGFGENDVESRIRHTLNFKKATYGVMAAGAVLVVLAFQFLGFNGAGESEVEPAATVTPAETLYGAKNPYVGNHIADGTVIGTIAETLPDWGFQKVLSRGYTSELQTSEEPYGFCFVFGDEENPNPWSSDEEIRLGYEMHYGATLMLALIDNLGEVDWRYYDESGERHTWYWDLSAAQEWLKVEDLKAFAGSAEELQKLLDLLEERRANPQEDEFPEVTAALENAAKEDDTGAAALESPSQESFAAWYETLPYELYEGAIAWNAAEAESYLRAEETLMFLLAETEDHVAAVYGCFDPKYGARGMTIDYRITPDGDSNHTYLDYNWNILGPEVQIAHGNFLEDGDGPEEIELIFDDVLEEKCRGVFAAYETGTLAIREFERIPVEEGR